MNKLEKWLWVNCTLKDNGQTSNSLYFYYKKVYIEILVISLRKSCVVVFYRATYITSFLTSSLTSL